MEWIVRLAWAALALVHLSPAAAGVAPRLVEKLYGVPPEGTAGLLLVHRGWLFAAVLLASSMALFDPASRRMASVVVGVSMIGFLVVYLRSGAPSGPLRAVAWVDAVALLPWFAVVADAWWFRAGR